MKLLFTKTFIQDYQRLFFYIQKQTDRQLTRLVKDVYHSSLRIKKIKDSRDIWEGRINKNYRFTFQIEEDTYILRQIKKSRDYNSLI